MARIRPKLLLHQSYEHVILYTFNGAAILFLCYPYILPYSMICISFIQDFLLEGGNISGDNKLKQTVSKVFL